MSVSGISFNILMFGIIAYVVLELVAYGRVFEKMGAPAWVIFIPGYDLYVLCKKCWNKGAFWVMLVFAVLSFAACVFGFEFLVEMEAGGVFTDAERTVAMIATGVGIVFLLIVLALLIRLMLHIARAFGEGGPMAALLAILWPAAILVLGLGKNKYVGNAKERKLMKQGLMPVEAEDID